MPNSEGINSQEPQEGLTSSVEAQLKELRDTYQDMDELIAQTRKYLEGVENLIVNFDQTLIEEVAPFKWLEYRREQELIDQNQPVDSEQILAEVRAKLGEARKKQAADPDGKSWIHHFYQEFIKGIPKEQLLQEYAAVADRLNIREQFIAMIKAIKQQVPDKEINIINLSLNNSLLIRTLLDNNSEILEELETQGIKFSGIIANEIVFDDNDIATGEIEEFVTKENKADYLPANAIIILDNSDEKSIDQYVEEHPGHEVNYINVERQIQNLENMASLSLEMRQIMVDLEKTIQILELATHELEQAQARLDELAQIEEPSDDEEQELTKAVSQNKAIIEERQAIIEESRARLAEIKQQKLENYAE